MSSGSAPGNPTGKGAPRRGRVHTFSAASRRRFRSWLLKHGAPEGWCSYGVTFTVPGGPFSVGEYRDLWRDWYRCVQRVGWLVVWRAEVQRRGALHWHCLVCMESGDVHAGAGRVEASWRVCLDDKWPRVVYPRPVKVWVASGEYDLAVEGPLSWWPGADEHCVRVEHCERGRGAWYRYLADHASKIKRDQVGEDIGRHWGVVGRRAAVSLRGDRHELSDQAYARFRRAYERLATPSVVDDRSVFGKHLGGRCRRGRSGSAVCFVQPATGARLLSWACTGSSSSKQSSDDRCRTTERPSTGP